MANEKITYSGIAVSKWPCKLLAAPSRGLVTGAYKCLATPQEDDRSLYFGSTVEVLNIPAQLGSVFTSRRAC
jgi:hypothetical protein